jgi:Fe-Mn family superoxide dismutase
MKRVFFIVLILGIFHSVNVRGIDSKSSSVQKSEMQPAGKLQFKPLPYAFDALEPYIDKQTVELHYTKHHKSAYDNFMAAIKGTPMETMDIKDIFKNISKYPAAVRNNGGSTFNHTMYWDNMKAKGGGMPSGNLLNAIVKSFGRFDEFQRQFSEAAKNRFGSGYAWLCMDEKGNLFVFSTPNQDNPLMDLAEKKGEPLLVLDVWEHAYYLKYQNRRAEYVDAFWNLVNWDVVAVRYETALKGLAKK